MATNCPGQMVPEMLSRTILDYVGSPYSQKRTFLRWGIVFTVRFSNVSWIFFLVDGLKDFFWRAWIAN